MLDPLELELERAAQLDVESAERLVEQQGRGAVDERPRERDALLLPTGQLLWLALLHPGQRDDLEDLGDAVALLALSDLLQLQPEGDVVVHRHVREQRVVLEHHVDVTSVRGDVRDVVAAEQDPPAASAPRTPRSSAAWSSSRTRTARAS